MVEVIQSMLILTIFKYVVYPYHQYLPLLIR